MALNVNNLEGNEIADDYIRTSVPKGRWSDTWYVFKSNFIKLFFINLFVLVTFIPGIMMMMFRSGYLTMLGNVYPFSVLGYPYYPDVVGLAERLTLSADLLFYATLIVAGFIASIGISGMAYFVRRLINTHGEKIKGLKQNIKTFFHGIRVCYFHTVFPISIFMVFLFASFMVGDWKDIIIATGGNAAGAITAYVFIIIATVLVGIYCAWMFAVGTSYRVKFTQLIKNSFVLMVGSPIRTIFMAGFSLLPVWLYLIGGFVQTISLVIFILVGFVFVVLCWTGFTQSVFDAYVNPSLKAVEEKKKAERTEEEKVQDDKQHARELLAAGRSELISHPIMPIESGSASVQLGKTFTRADVASVEENRNKIKADVAAYENAHKNDTVYVEYNKLFAEREKALADQPGKKGKKKRISSDNLLK